MKGERMKSNMIESKPKSLRDYPELVTVQQVANCTQLSRGTIYNMVHDGKLRAVFPRGNTIRLNRDEVCDFFCL